ncbi:MAG: hypothetical protein KGJ52_07630, partial [Gammaproteobacteria bacterium]|nr:hypothetical protein [Gammaproteobacteria bacterium]
GFTDDKPGTRPPRGKSAEPPSAGGGAPRDGVRHDSRGNAVWQWAIDTGKHAIDSTSRLLKRLEVPGLRLEDDPKPDEKGPARQEQAGGYDPYGGRPGAKASAAQPVARPATAVRKPAAAPPARPSFWRRLFRRG